MKLVQAAIFVVAIGWVITWDTPSSKNGVAVAVFGVFVVFITTVIPWLIFMMIKQAFDDIRKRRSKPARVDVVIPELLEDGVPGRWVSGDSRPRIGK